MLVLPRRRHGGGMTSFALAGRLAVLAGRLAGPVLVLPRVKTIRLSVVSDRQ
jgi:hypothetical protein